MSTSRVYTVGQVLTAAQVNDLSQGVISKQATTSNVGPTSGTTELAIITAGSSVAGTNRRLRLSFHCRNVTGTVTGDIFILRIKEGATVLQEGHFFVASGGAAAGITAAFAAIVDSPSAGAHTYQATIQQVSGTGTATLSGTASAPILLVVEDVGTV